MYVRTSPAVHRAKGFTLTAFPEDVIGDDRGSGARSGVLAPQPTHPRHLPLFSQEAYEWRYLAVLTARVDVFAPTLVWGDGGAHDLQVQVIRVANLFNILQSLRKVIYCVSKKKLP